MQQSPRGTSDRMNFQQLPSGRAHNLRSGPIQLRPGHQQHAPGHAHQMDPGHINQQQGQSHTHHAFGRGKLIGNTLQQQQHPGNQFHQNALSTKMLPGQNQFGSPIGHSPNQSRPQAPAVLQPHHPSQLPQQQQQQISNPLLTGQSQQVTGGQAQVQAHHVGSLFQAQTARLHNQTELQLHGHEQNVHQSRGGLTPTQLLQVQQLAAQRSHSVVPQSQLAMGNRPSVSPAQTQLSSAQRVLMQPSVQGTTLQATLPHQKSSVVSGPPSLQSSGLGGAQQSLLQSSVVGRAQQALLQPPSIVGGAQQSLLQSNVVGGAHQQFLLPKQQAALPGLPLIQVPDKVSSHCQI